jgi:hypothetical protein
VDAEIEKRDIPGFPGYKVDRTGNIYGVRSGRLIPSKNKGYLQITLRFRPDPTGGLISRTRWIHGLVLVTFVGQKPTKSHQARHLDGNSVNNHIDNLCWGTPKENATDKIRHGTATKPMEKSRYNGHIGIIKSLRFEEKMTLKAIALMYKTSISQISRIVKGVLWSEH